MSRLCQIDRDGPAQTLREARDWYSLSYTFTGYITQITNVSTNWSSLIRRVKKKAEKCGF